MLGSRLRTLATFALCGLLFTKWKLDPPRPDSFICYFEKTTKFSASAAAAAGAGGGGNTCSTGEGGSNLFS